MNVRKLSWCIVAVVVSLTAACSGVEGSSADGGTVGGCCNVNPDGGAGADAGRNDSGM